MQYFELVFGDAVDARSAINKFSLVASAVAGDGGLRLTLDSEWHLSHQFGIKHDDVKPWLDLCRRRRVAQLRHPLTVARRRILVGPTVAGSSGRRRRMDGTTEVRRKATDIRHR